MCFWHRCPTRAYCTRPSIEIFLSITNIILNQYMIQSKMPSHVWNIRRVKPCPGKARRAEQNILSSSSAPQWEVRFCRFQVLCSNVQTVGDREMTGGRGEKSVPGAFFEGSLAPGTFLAWWPGASRTETDDLGSWGGLRGSKFSWWGEFFLDILMIIYIYYIDYSWDRFQILAVYGSLTW